MPTNANYGKDASKERRTTRRSNRGDHGLANPIFSGKMQLRIIDDGRVRKLTVTTCRLENYANFNRT